MLNVTIHSQHFELSPEIKRFAHDQIAEPLQRIWDRDGTELEIHMRDLRGGDKRGLDKECRCVLRLPNSRQLVITEVTEDMRRSIHQARKRLMRRAREYLDQLGGPRWPRKFYAARVVNEGLVDNPVRVARSDEVPGRETLH